jgi:hypothetical protein
MRIIAFMFIMELLECLVLLSEWCWCSWLENVSHFPTVVGNCG